MPVVEYEYAKRAAGSRGITIAEYLARCIRLQQQLAGGEDVDAVLALLELEATTT